MTDETFTGSDLLAYLKERLAANLAHMKRTNQMDSDYLDGANTQIKEICVGLGLCDYYDLQDSKFMKD